MYNFTMHSESGYHNWAFPREKSEKKGQRQKANFFLKNMSHYSAFGYLNLFYQTFCCFGNIILVLALERKIAQKWMLMIIFFIFFFLY